MSTETVALKLTRQDGPPDHLSVAQKVKIEQGRAHEICGPSRHVWAMVIAREIARQNTGSLFWITPQWFPEKLYFEGMQIWAPPERVIQITPREEIDLLWASEEILRSGAAPLVMTQITRFPNLTQVRRLHLAAQNGSKTGPYKPICLLLSTDQGGITGVDNRFLCRAEHHAQTQVWRLLRTKARHQPVAEWTFTGPNPVTLKAQQRHDHSEST